MNWHDDWHKLIIVLLAVDHLFDRLEPLWKRFQKGADMEKIEAVVKLIPQFEAVVSDGDAVVAEGTVDPKVQKLVTDLKTLVVSLKAVVA